MQGLRPCIFVGIILFFTEDDLDLFRVKRDGVDLLKLMKHLPVVSMATVFSEYALDGYEWNKRITCSGLFLTGVSESHIKT